MGTPFDLLQGVNKGFWAGGAGAPVDTLTLALNALIAGGGYAGHKMGFLDKPPDLIEKPVGGSEWIADKMRSRGLLQDNPGSTADNIGNVLGGLLGPVTAAKAPQIARGLLQGGENLAAPRTLNSQTGAIVWHGSPHKFDKFDSSKIGTGEGAQAYGHGVYFAESPDVAQAYANKLTKVDGQAISDQLDSRTRYLNMLKQQAASGDTNAAKNIPIIEKSISDLKSNGSLYKVDLPDEHIAKMLDWDKPLSQQHPDVQSVLLKHPDVLDQIQKAEAQRVLLNERSPMRLDKIPSASIPYDASRMVGKDALTAIQQRSGLGVTGGVEQQLRQAGIPGIRYLDGGSRGAGQGSSNFVVFPGNEGLLSILERNGAPIK